MAHGKDIDAEIVEALRSFVNVCKILLGIWFRVASKTSFENISRLVISRITEQHSRRIREILEIPKVPRMQCFSTA